METKTICCWGVDNILRLHTTNYIEKYTTLISIGRKEGKCQIT